MRALVMDFDSDKNVTDISNEYMFGPSLLVAPVTSYKERTKDVYLPSGCGWFDFYSGKYFSGGQKVNVQAPLNKIPLFIKEGSIIPVGPEIQYAEQKPDTGITLYVYTGKNASFTLYDDQNNNNDYKSGSYSMISFNYNEKEGKLTIGEPKGTYKGMPSKRTFQIVWIDKNEPKAFLSGMRKGTKVNYLNRKLELNKNR